MSLIYNATFDSQTRLLLLLDKAGNVISSCEVPSNDVDDATKPLTFMAIQDNSTVTLTKNGTPSGAFQTSRDGGRTWSNYTIGASITLNIGDEVSFRAKADRTSAQSAGNYFSFTMTGKIEAWHNIMSLYRTSDFATYESVVPYAFSLLFYNCRSLTKAPLLPATTLADSCYWNMFWETSLTKAPELPATELVIDCYYTMFQGCRSLKEVRVSATTTTPRALTRWLSDVSATGDFYCDPNTDIFPTGESGIPKNWNRWVRGAEATETTTTMYHNGVAETIIVGTSSYGTCYSVQGWVGFRTLAQMHDLGYVFQEPVPTTMYHNGSTETIGKIEANGADGFTEDMYILNSSLKTLSEMPAFGYTLGAQTPITMYHHDTPVSAYSCEANTEDGFTETMYDVGNGKGYLTIAQQNANGFYLVSTPYTGLTLTATADNSSVKLTKNGTLSNTFEVDTGNGWQSYKFGTVINLNSGQSCKWRCSTHHTTQSDSNYATFVMTGTIEASGNINSMLDGTNFGSMVSLSGYDYAFYSMFEDCTSLTHAPELPVTALVDNCYRYMFSGCTSLTQAPELPSTTLAPYCYYAMFEDCTSLTHAPELPVTALVDNCYRYMFSGCTSLTQAPELPSTTLAPYCYYGMFNGCTSLTQAPELPATTLAPYCYYAMFSGCTSLTQAPELPATTLAKYCYVQMFARCEFKKAPELPATTLAPYCYHAMFLSCSYLSLPPLLPATTLAESCYGRMFYNCFHLSEVRVSATKTAPNALDSWLVNTSEYGIFYCDPNATIFPVDSTSGCPEGWKRRDINLLNALTLTATADNSSVKLTKNGTLDNTFEVDTGNGWTAYEFDTVIPLNAGQSCKWRCSAHPTTQSASNYVKFVMTGAIEASGNVNSMLSRDFKNLTSLSGYDYAFTRLFYSCTSLVQAPNLPATTLATYCYEYMFYDCTSLVQSPELPATTLANNCYTCMFNSCTSLVQAPELPATILADFCYYYMFNGCTSLVQAPNLPATTLVTYCYGYMFRNCTSLTQAPALPVTTLADFCYASMFSGCKALTQAPELPATTLAKECYTKMFDGCKSLKEVRISATTTATRALANWLDGVSATGDFYCDPNATIFPTGGSGIPQNWTRHALADYPVNP